ncbi:hypothetical protein MESS2_1270009 [Mesorhizobium metallidurans STM 2683]|uniref:Uncharacterized protein n=1 Tax=Mesorhizobium metallidurans STM 2683 TaxID=1297569 RepID=M5EI65_9HYPH|nr:hypothetical protein MESS2_1270009 [Mesorhizobium metallidurans STM 2683]
MATGRLDGFTGRFSLVIVLMCLAVLWLGCIDGGELPIRRRLHSNVKRTDLASPNVC